MKYLEPKFAREPQPPQKSLDPFGGAGASSKRITRRYLAILSGEHVTLTEVEQGMHNDVEHPKVEQLDEEFDLPRRLYSTMYPQSRRVEHNHTSNFLLKF